MSVCVFYLKTTNYETLKLHIFEVVINLKNSAFKLLYKFHNNRTVHIQSNTDPL